MSINEAQGVWIGPDGAMRQLRMKSGGLFEGFHGIGNKWRHEVALNGSAGDLAYAYSSVVWAYRCIKLRGDALAGVPLMLVDRDGERITEHPILDLLRDVNPRTMNWGDLLRATEAAYNIWGVAYWRKIMTPSGRVLALDWLNPQIIQPVTDSARGITGYKQTLGSKTHTYAPDEIIMFRNFDPSDDLNGLSPLSVAIQEVNAEINAARFVAAFFANDARPAGLLTTDATLKEGDVERIQTWWEKLFKGAINSWKTGIVGGGLKWQTISFPPTDLALAELRAEDRRAICAVFGVPAGMAGAWEATTYATAREQKASFYEDTLIPQMQYLAEVLNWSLLRPHYPDLARRGARLLFDIDSIAALHESASEKAERLTKLFQAGIISLNEVRAGLGLPAWEEPSADDEDDDEEALDPEAAAKALQDDLARWERFAVKRVKSGQRLRAFSSAAIPPELWFRIAIPLRRAATADDVHRIFDSVSSRYAVSSRDRPPVNGRAAGDKAAQAA